MIASDAPTASSSSHQLLLDARARRSLEQRVRELAARVAEARERGDVTVQAGAEEELDGLAVHLAEASAFGGRARTFADGRECARTVVRKAVIRAVDQVAAVDDVAGRPTYGPGAKLVRAARYDTWASYVVVRSPSPWRPAAGTTGLHQ